MRLQRSKNRIRSLLVTMLAAAASAALFAAPAPATTPPVGVTIVGTSIADYAFAPEIVTVGKGTTVHWHWNSTAPHNVTFRSLGKASKTAAKGSFAHAFRKPGAYRYHCSIHGFKGKVIVK